jgi:hypothetical protein
VAKKTKEEKQMDGILETLQNSRVRETYEVYDTFYVIDASGPIAAAKLQQLDFCASFAELALRDKVSFFTSRIDTDLGKAVTNKKQRGQMSFGMAAIALGVQPFVPDAIPFANGEADEIWPSAANTLAIWHDLVINHSAVTLKIAEDDRITLLSARAPMGVGSSNTNGLPNNNGNADRPNMAVFGEPLAIPSNVNFAVELEFDAFAKAVLTKLSLTTPPTFEIDSGSNPIVKIPYPFGIRVCLAGFRELQMRGALSAS